MKETVQVLGFEVYCDSLNNLIFSVDKQICINTINAYSYILTKRDVFFMEALRSSDILLPDGFPIAYAALLLQRMKIKKIAGEDIFFYLLNRMNQENGKVFFLGASESTLHKISSRIKKEYPGITVKSFSPPYKKEFAVEESLEMLEKINLFKPDVLFVGMTAPKQEKWVHCYKAHINANVVCSIGAVFDFYAQTIKRPSAFWINLHLEWFIRLIREPNRLWRRYLWYSPQFLFDVIKAKVRSYLDKH